MSEKYDKIMGKIEVTEGMRRNVLSAVQNADLSAGSKIIRFPNWKRYLSAAACLVVIVSCVFLGFKLFHQTGSPPVQASGTISECAGIDELAETVGFPISDVATLPFEATASSYISFWGRLGQIVYSGADGQSAVYRKSVGSEDNSGDYNDYSDIEEIKEGSVTVTLKGNDGLYNLAWWTDGEYSYSLSISPGTDISAWETIIEGIQ